MARSPISLRRLLCGLGIGGVCLVSIALLQPYPRWQEGATFCLPWLGPRMSLPASLSDSARTRVVAHETVHAAQCRALGSWSLFTAHWSVARRLKLEAEAGCAEALFGLAHGRRPDLAFEGLVDDLTYGVPRGSAPGPDAARAAATRACPELALAAQQAPADFVPSSDTVKR